ncbi:hypothetical protein DPMN_129864 [Dreissena polymorpha]|uniref:Uncharacterized protein n=1 Tax=Dreissena polymorpha TaxID=45954 RepID=A0A9D4H3I4_DREPO|nr:hypothetical protein DPMN_129864 [Dreissena polymorpha]
MHTSKQSLPKVNDTRKHSVGFSKVGHFLYASDVVQIEKLFPCESFREKDPIGKEKALKGE